jgi:hypothetical protein
MKAYAISTIQREKDQVVASTAERPSIFEVDDKEYRRLERMGAVRKPTDHELKLAETYAKAEGEDDEFQDGEKLTVLDAQPVELGMQAATVQPDDEEKQKTTAPSKAATPSVEQAPSTTAAKPSKPAGKSTTTTNDDI